MSRHTTPITDQLEAYIRSVSVREPDEMVRAARGPAFPMAGQFTVWPPRGSTSRRMFATSVFAARLG